MRDRHRRKLRERGRGDQRARFGRLWSRHHHKISPLVRYHRDLSGMNAGKSPCRSARSPGLHHLLNDPALVRFIADSLWRIFEKFPFLGDWGRRTGSICTAWPSLQSNSPNSPPGPPANWECPAHTAAPASESTYTASPDIGPGPPVSNKPARPSSGFPVNFIACGNACTSAGGSVFSIMMTC
jgi:hypothetical protein